MKNNHPSPPFFKEGNEFAFGEERGGFCSLVQISEIKPSPLGF